MNSSSIHEQIVVMIAEIRTNISQDTSQGSTIPDWYDEIKLLLDAAEDFLNVGNTERALDIIGDINVDLLEQVDRFDDKVLEVVHHLKLLQEKCRISEKEIPNEIISELEILRKILHIYIYDISE